MGKQYFAGSTRLLAVCGGLFLMSAALSAPPKTARIVPYTSEQKANFNEKGHGYKGEITGKVVFEDGKPAVGFLVEARFKLHQTGAPGEGETTTDSNGYYRIHGLNPQSFIVWVANENKPYIPDPERTIALDNYPNQKAANINFTLRLGSKITVRVREAETGLPVAGITVIAKSFIGSDAQVVGETNKDGDLVFRGNRMAFEMELSGDKLKNPRLGPAPGYSFYNQTQLQEITDVVWEVKVYTDYATYPKRTFHGIVKNAKGEPVNGATVKIDRFTDHINCLTDEEGRFSFQTVRLESERRGLAIKAEKGSESALIFPTAEQTWGTVLVPLQAVQRPTISGQAVGADGKPVQGVVVRCLESYPDSEARAMLYPADSQITDADGKFMVSNLFAEAAYKVELGGFSENCHNIKWGQSSVPPNRFDAYLRLQNGESKNVGSVVVFPADTAIAGRIVTTKPLTSLERLDVLIEGKHTVKFADIDAQNHFHTEELVNEPLTISVLLETKTNAYTTKQTLLYKGEVHAGDTNIKIVLPDKK